MKIFRDVLLFCMIAVVFFGTYSCGETESITPESDTSISVENNYLVFLNIEDYNDLLDSESKLDKILEIKSNYPFVSMADYLEGKNFRVKSGVNHIPDTEEYEKGSFLYNLLSADGMIQIGKWICKINLNTKKAYVLNVKHRSKLQSLYDEKGDNSYIYEFTTDDELIPIFETIEDEKISMEEVIEYLRGRSNGRIEGCNSVNGVDLERKCADLEYTYNGETYSAKAKLDYQKAAVYFAVKTKIKNYKKGGIGGLECNLNFQGRQWINYGSILVNN